MSVMRIQYALICESVYQFDPNFGRLVQSMLAETHLFHQILATNWMYLGYHPMVLPQMGLMPFGDIELDMNKGEIKLITMSENRLKQLSSLLKEMMAFGHIPIVDATIEVNGMAGKKPDPQAVERCKQILVDGLDIQVGSTKQNKNFMRHKICAWCGSNEEDKLKHCSSCQQVYYVSLLTPR